LLIDTVLPEFVASNVDLVYQHDNAPCHTARSIRAFLAEQNMQVLDWPPQSPDLSPIEWMWNVIKMKLKALNPRPRTKEGIIEAVYQIWTDMNPEIGKKVCMTFRKRMEECINKKGHLIGF
jgi:transposase